MGLTRLQSILVGVLLLVASHASGQRYLPIPIGQTHTPAVTYRTWNATYMGTVGVLSANKLTFTQSTSGNCVVIATLPGGSTGIATGGATDYYYEVTINTLGNNMSIGLENSNAPNLNTWMGADVHGYGYYSTGSTGGSWQAGVISFSPPPTTLYNSGDVVGIQFKSTTSQIIMYVKHSGVTTTEATFSVAAGSYFPAMSNNGGSSTANFGASAWQLSGAPFGASAWTN